MSALLSLVVLLAAPEGSYSPPTGPAQQPAATSPRTGRELEQVVRAALRRWAKPAKDQAEPAAREFLALYEELQRDTALARSVRQELGGKVRGRLAGLARQLGKQAAADQPAGVGRANQGGALGQRAGGPGLGGAAPGGGFGPPAAAGPRNAGEDLVELIQRVIRPNSWERMGGPGTIRYWPPGRAMVARASDDVHGRMADLIDLLDGLER